MKILFATSEANPFASSGGLGDVLEALPKALVNSVEKAEVIMPLYDTISKDYKDKFKKVTDISFNLSWRKTGASIYSLEKDGVNYYFVENHRYFDRCRLYGEYDDAERFAFFSLAVIEYIIQTGNIPDILHLNDWQTALCVIYLKTIYASFDEISNIKTVYTIHNIEYQGKFPKDILGDVFGIDYSHYNTLEYDGCINLTKGAIELADMVTTVSPNYANELKTPYFSFGLSDVIKRNENKITGVINGIDYNYFSPSTGGDIAFSYNKFTRKSGKAKNKSLVLKKLGLEDFIDRPMLVMITRLAKGKGIDLVLHIIEELLEKNITFVVLGTGEKMYEFAFSSLEDKYKNFKAIIKFDRIIAKELYASADIFLMPSQSEPCGLAQMISCSYATVPIVRAVGGLFDSIIPYPAQNSNGFWFSNYNAHELLYKINEALSLYQNSDEWDKLTLRAIKSDFSWNKSAQKYLEIYKKIMFGN